MQRDPQDGPERNIEVISLRRRDVPEAGTILEAAGAPRDQGSPQLSRPPGRGRGRIKLPALAIMAVAALIVLAMPMDSPGTLTPSPFPPSELHDRTVISENGTYTVKSAANEVVHVSMDADAAIAAALDSLPRDRAVKGSVMLRGGFILARAIEVPSHTLLQLDGRVAMRLLSASHLANATNATDIDIIGGEWDGNKAAQLSGGSDRDGFSFSGCSRVTISNLTIHGAPFNNINIVGGDNVTVSHVHSYGAGDRFRGQQYRGHGIMMYACSDSVVEHCHVHDTSKGGIYFYTEDDGVSERLANNIVRNNLVERTWTTGIEVGNRGTNDVCTGNVIRDNTVIDGGMDGEHMGIAVGWWGPTSGAVRYADHCTVDGNTVSQSGKYRCGGGISLMAHDSSCSNNVVRDIATAAVGCRGDRNIISGNDIDRAAIGVQFWDGSNNEVVGNDIAACAMGVALYKGLTSGCSYNHFANNRIEGSTNVAFLINEAGDTGNIIENNVFVGKSTIVNQGTGTIIRNNSVA